MPSAGVTIHDVARAANVSPSTVSNVLNGRSERMAPETCDRVRRAMADLGYAPNQVARSLKTGFLPTIGLIVPSVANPFWGAFAREVEHAALARGCQVLLCNGERDPAREQQYAESMLARGIRGVILGSAPISMQHFLGLMRRGLEVVTFDRQPAGSDGVEFDSVRVDNIGGVRLAVEHLYDLGHRKIAFVSGPINSSSRRDRLKAFEVALADFGLKRAADWIWTDAGEAGVDEGSKVGKQAARSLLGRGNRPTGLLAINDLTALGVYAGARELGLEVPRDVSVVGFDDIALCDLVTPPLTTVRQPLDELMRAAVELLLARLEHKRTGPATHLTLPARLVVRGSTQAPPAPAKVRTVR